MTEDSFNNIIATIAVLSVIYTGISLTGVFMEWNAERDCAAEHQVYMCVQDETWYPVKGDSENE